jgi:hypothetical protein
VVDSVIADELFALWIAQNDRPMIMPSEDAALQIIINYCLSAPSDTGYSCPDYARVHASLIRLEERGVTVDADFVAAQLADGIKLSAGEGCYSAWLMCFAGADIWSDKAVSLLGIVLYGINKVIYKAKYQILTNSKCSLFENIKYKFLAI